MVMTSNFNSDNFEKFKEKYNKSLFNYYEREKSTRKSEEDIKKKYDRDEIIEEKYKEAAKEHRTKYQEKINRHRENMRSLDLNRVQRLEKMIERINKSPINKKNCEIKPKNKLRTHSVIQNRLEELDIDDKLDDLNKKMMRSSENYRRNLKNKVERIKTSRKRNNSVNNSRSESSDFNEKVINMVRKRENANSRRERLKKEFYEKINLKENKMIEKMQKLNQILENENSVINGKKKYIIDKELKSHEFIKRINKKRKEELELKQEKHKLFEEEVITNINRQKRIDAIKKERIIEKHVELYQRQNQHHLVLDSFNKKTRQKAMNFTIQREKMHEIKARISKSQTPEKVKKLFKSLR